MLSKNNIAIDMSMRAPDVRRENMDLALTL